ncbi:MAG: UDP-N-acetylmuramoyl-L-alanine--D-glutamate ligase [Bryobacteraceae bacterium]
MTSTLTTIAGIDPRNAAVLVVGLARSGVAALRLLAREGAVVTGTDSRALADLPEAAAALTRAGAVFLPESSVQSDRYALVVISPGVPVDTPLLGAARAAGVPIIGEMELASYFMAGPVSAITGSNGKTTTTALHGHILREAGIAAQVGGNIGTPPAAMIETSRGDQWNVLEVSSFQLETISHFRAGIGACLNVTPDHLDRHGSMKAYERAKGRLFETQDEGGVAVLNADDEACVRFASLGAGRKTWFSLQCPVSSGWWLDEGTIWHDGQRVLEAASIPLRGRHNIENVLAAASCSSLAGAPHAAIAAAVTTFPGVEHRLEFVRALDGVDFYNDSKATNVDATLKAIDAFEGGLWVILGGKDKGSDYRPLREPLAARARAVLLVGAAAPVIASHLEGAVPLVDCGAIAEAVRYASGRAAPGETVLLAPACASFDQFESYEHRGRVFKQLVQQLRGKGEGEGA